ncbi:peroxidase-related enzyme [Leucobacter sp. GX24907]
MSTEAANLTEVLALPADAERVRSSRPEVVAHLDEAYQALYLTEQVLPTPVLHAIAAIVARHQRNAALMQHHSALADASLIGEDLPSDPKLRALLQHVDLITLSPALVTHEDQAALDVAGVTPDEIVLASQVVAFTSTAVRVQHAFALIGGRTPRRVDPFVRRTVAHGRARDLQARTVRGSRHPERFSREPLDWEPWVPVPSEEELTVEQRETLGSKASAEYSRLLARVPAILQARSALDDAVFRGRGGLPRGERELAATVTSKVNDCVYCASVHASKAEFQTKRTDDIDRVLAVTLQRDADWVARDVERLADGQDDRWTALIRFAAHLSELVPTADEFDVKRLVEQGLRLEEIADAALATAFFSWANRLMLSLGEAAIPGTAPLR